MPSHLCERLLVQIDSVPLREAGTRLHLDGRSCSSASVTRTNIVSLHGSEHRCSVICRSSLTRECKPDGANLACVHIISFSMCLILSVLRILLTLNHSFDLQCMFH